MANARIVVNGESHIIMGSSEFLNTIVESIVNAHDDYGYEIDCYGRGGPDVDWKLTGPDDEKIRIAVRY